MSNIIKARPFTKDEMVGVDCRHVTYCLAHDKKSDLHVAKSYIHFKDGTRMPKMILRKNFEREVWVTREGYRNHKDKKEYEVEERLQRFTTPQFKLLDTIAKGLYGRPFANSNYKRLASSPYLYGTDIESTCLVKKEYAVKYPDCISESAEVAVLDIETDVVKGNSEIILITLSFKDKIITAINTNFIPRSSDPIARINSLMDKELGHVLKPRNANVELVLCDGPDLCCIEVFKRAHEWMPDFITIWNMDYDLPIIVDTLEQHGHDVGDILSDPSVPKEYRFYKYTEGARQKKTQSGKIMPLHWADQWHVAECPASFYFIDAACLYKRLRIAKGMEPSYALDDILHKHIGTGKLTVPELEGVEGLPWHYRMQKEFPFHYVVYNIFDCVGVELLDEKTGDISRNFCALSGDSDFKNFNKNPRRIVDDMHFFYRETKEVIATTGSDIGDDENDEYVIGLNKWIVTLPACHMGQVGRRIIKELPTVVSLMMFHNADIDIEGTYPNVEAGANTAKETTVRELSTIEGLNEERRRELGINISGGPINAIEFCVTALDLPTPLQWLDLYDSRHVN